MASTLSHIVYRTTQYTIWIIAEAIDLRRPYWILHLVSCHTPDAVTTVFKCSWGWTQKVSEMCRVLLQLLINILPSRIMLVLYIYINWFCFNNHIFHSSASTVINSWHRNVRSVICYLFSDKWLFVFSLSSSFTFASSFVLTLTESLHFNRTRKITARVFQWSDVSSNLSSRKEISRIETTGNDVLLLNTLFEK